MFSHGYIEQIKQLEKDIKEFPKEMLEEIYK
jgi:hypothetical protein